MRPQLGECGGDRRFDRWVEARDLSDRLPSCLDEEVDDRSNAKRRMHGRELLQRDRARLVYRSKIGRQITDGPFDQRAAAKIRYLSEPGNNVDIGPRR